MQKIEIKDLCKKIKKKTIFKNINLTMEAGGIYGFVGSNGSGKTMFFRAIAGLIKPTEGQILIDDKESNMFKSYKGNIGLVIENIGLYPHMTGFNNLKYLASINKIVTDDIIRKTISEVGLDPDDKRKIRKYSLGMKQKIVLAQAFMESPELILLDEPTNGLDEISVNKIREKIKDEAKRGAIVAIASHNREDIECLCDKTYNVKNGEITEVVL